MHIDLELKALPSLLLVVHRDPFISDLGPEAHPEAAERCLAVGWIEFERWPAVANVGEEYPATDTYTSQPVDFPTTYETGVQRNIEPGFDTGGHEAQRFVGTGSAWYDGVELWVVDEVEVMEWLSLEVLEHECLHRQHRFGHPVYAIHR